MEQKVVNKNHYKMTIESTIIKNKWSVNNKNYYGISSKSEIWNSQNESKLAIKETGWRHLEGAHYWLDKAVQKIQKN